MNAPQPAKEIAPDTVVVTTEAHSFTAKELSAFIEQYPPELQQMLRNNPALLRNALIMNYLAEEAVKASLDKQPPLNQTLTYLRAKTLMQAELNKYRQDIPITLEDQKKYYAEHSDKYKQAKVQAILVSFGGAAKADAPKPRTEAEAKQIIEGLRKQALAGSDFGKLASEHSDDKESKAKNGEFGVIKSSSSYPEAMKKAVFALKPGEISEPLREPSGFYLFKVEEVSPEPFDEVRSPMFTEMQQAKFNEWIAGLNKRFAVKVEHPEFFKPGSAPAAR